MAYDDISLAELRDKLGIDVNAGSNANCPFCGKTSRKTLHFDDRTNLWRCASCEASGGVLHLYARYQLGMESLPSDKAERKKIRRDMYEFMGYNNPVIRRNRPKPKPVPQALEAAPDAQVHAVYSAMASLAEFHLSADHKKALRKRGLPDGIIERNGYRTFPYRTRIPAEIVKLYDSVDPALRKDFSSKKASQIQLGLHVAHQLEERGFDLTGIPGFYKFGSHWCLTYTPGLLIPTRNILGEIVRWQVRKDFGETKYMTLSCGTKPGAVNGEVSRCHFPLGNAKLTNPAAKVIFTEGPLKADIASALNRDPSIFMAVHGVNNTKDLYANCEKLKEAGISTVYNAFDMDRYTNPNVRRSTSAICEQMKAIGFDVIPMCWGNEHAAKLLADYCSILQEKSIPLPDLTEHFSQEEQIQTLSNALCLAGIPFQPAALKGAPGNILLAACRSIVRSRSVPVPVTIYPLSVFDKLNIVADALNRAGIDPGKKKDKDSHDDYWEPTTKGIDDYLFSQIQRKEHTQTERTDYIRSYHETLLRLGNE